MLSVIYQERLVGFISRKPCLPILLEFEESSKKINLLVINSEKNPNLVLLGKKQKPHQKMSLCHPRDAD